MNKILLHTTMYAATTCSSFIRPHSFWGSYKQQWISLSTLQTLELLVGTSETEQLGRSACGLSWARIYLFKLNWNVSSWAPVLPSVRPFTKLDPSNSEEQRACTPTLCSGWSYLIFIVVVCAAGWFCLERSLVRTKKKKKKNARSFYETKGVAQCLRRIARALFSLLHTKREESLKTTWLWEREREREREILSDNQTSSTVEIRTSFFFFVYLRVRTGWGSWGLCPKEYGWREKPSSSDLSTCRRSKLRTWVTLHVLSIHTKPFMPHIKSSTQLWVKKGNCVNKVPEIKQLNNWWSRFICVHFRALTLGAG